VETPLDDITQKKMDSATTMKLAQFRNRRITHYENLAKEFMGKYDAYGGKIRELEEYRDKLAEECHGMEKRNEELMEQYKKIKDSAIREQMDAENNKLFELHPPKAKELNETIDQLNKTKNEHEQIGKQCQDVLDNHNKKVEEDAEIEKGKLEKLSSMQIKHTTESTSFHFDRNIKFTRVNEVIYTI
jgi:chromosome segregation ATPase